MKPPPISPEAPPEGPPATTSEGAALCWTPLRRDIKAWLTRNAPSLAELYEGAVRLIYTDQLPGRTRFIAHAVREIRNRLPDEVSGKTAHQRLEYKQRLDELASLPGTAVLLADLGGAIIPANPTISIDRDLATAIATLLEDHSTTSEKPIAAIRRLFEALAPENTRAGDNLVPVLQQWLNVTEWFVKRAHDAGRTDNYYDQATVKQQFAVFEATLAALTRPFFDTIEDLDAILEKANS